MNLDDDRFSEDNKRWKWYPWRWMIGLFVFWIINIVVMLISPNDSSHVMLLFLLLYIITGIITYRGEYRGFLVYRTWIFLGFIYTLLLYFGLDYVAQKVITSYNLLISEKILKQVLALIAVTPLVLWAMRISKHYVKPIELDNDKTGN